MSNIRTATLELTRNCNFHCTHCYVETTLRGGDYLESSEWIRIIDRLLGIGCHRFILTGGEVMMSAAFPAVYRYLKEKDCHIDIFTNGSTLKPLHKKLFLEHAPDSVSITLYGNSPEEYRAVTGCSGLVRDVVFKNVSILRSMGVRVNLGKLVCKDLDACVPVNVQVEMNTYLIPALHGRDNLKQRLSPKEVLDTEIQNSSRDEYNRKAYAADLKPLKLDSEDYLRKCPGGYSSIFVSATGLVSICAIYRSVSFSLLDEERPIQEILHELADVHKNFKKLYFNSKCGTCNLNSNCRNCPAYALLETGCTEKNPYLCELSRVRAEYYN